MDELLRKLGCKDIQDTKERFSDNIDFYLEVVILSLNEAAFDRLTEALNRKDTASAFEAAHSLRGVMSNCGITPMFRLIEQIVEPLRNGNPDYAYLLVLCDTLLKKRETTAALIAEYRGKSR